MKKLLLACILAHVPFNTFAALYPKTESALSSARPKVKIVNQRRHKLMLGELNRALENSTNALRRYKRQNELNKALPVRSRITPKKSDLQKHLAMYTMLKNIYDEYRETEQLLIPLELLTDLVQEEATREIVLTEAAAEQKRIEDEVATPLTSEHMSF